MHQCSIDHKLTAEVVSKTTFFLQSFALRSRPDDKNSRVLNFVWNSSSDLEKWADILSSNKDLEDEVFPKRSYWNSFEDAIKENPASAALTTYRDNESMIAVRLVTVENGFLVAHTVTIMRDAFRNKIS